MMFSTLFTTTLLFALFALRARADFFVATTGLTQCKPATLTWDKTNGPYNVIIVLASNPCGDAIVDLGDHDDNTVSLDNVKIPAGETVMISVLNRDDDEGWSGAITVQSSDDSSCLTPQNNTPSQPSPSPNYSSPSPTPTTTTSSSKSPAATVVGAANNGIMNSGTSTIHLSGMAVAFTTFCALVALL
jgi:hypothetical protein